MCEDYARLLKHLGTVYLGQGNLDRAEEFYGLARARYQQLELELSPGYCDLMVNLGRLQADELRRDMTYIQLQSITINYI